MKIEKGKFYRTRGGHKVEILRTDLKNNYPIVGVITDSNGHERYTSWSDGGIWLKRADNIYDILGEWEEVLDFDPYCLPQWADKWIAMDADGEWYCYSEKPDMNSRNKVHLSHGNTTRIQADFAPKNYSGNWKDSLHDVEKLKKDKL